MNGLIPQPLEFEPRSEAQMLARAKAFRALMQRRRTVRDSAARCGTFPIARFRARSSRMR